MGTPPKFNEKSANLKKEEVAVTLGAFDETNPQSLISICPPRMKVAIGQVLDPTTGNINWLSWSESRLTRQVEKARAEQVNDPNHKLGPEDHALRLSFWDEYYRCQRNKSKMAETQYLNGVMLHNQYYMRISLPIYTAWLISAPRSLAVQQEETLYHGIRLLREVVTSKDSIYEVKEVTKENADGSKERTRTKKLNTRAISEVRRIVEDLANRRQGSVVQRHQIAAQVNTNQHDALRLKEDTKHNALQAGESREDIEKDLEILEAEIELAKEVDEKGTQP